MKLTSQNDSSGYSYHGARIQCIAKMRKSRQDKQGHAAAYASTADAKMTEADTAITALEDNALPRCGRVSRTDKDMRQLMHHLLMSSRCMPVSTCRALLNHKLAEIQICFSSPIGLAPSQYHCNPHIPAVLNSKRRASSPCRGGRFRASSTSRFLRPENVRSNEEGIDNIYG